MTFQPLFSSDEQYSVQELIPSIWLLDRTVGDRPISDLRCLDLVVESASRLAHQSSHSGLRDVIDWWIVCRLDGEPRYCATPNAFGTTGFDEDLISHLNSMTANRGATGNIPVIEWMKIRRTFDSKVQDLETKMGEWRNSKGIRNIVHLIDMLEDEVGRAIDDLKSGEKPRNPLTSSEINRLLTDNDIREGSNLFRQWRRNLSYAGDSMQTAVNLLPALEPFQLPGLRVDQIGNGRLSGLSDEFRQAVSILLRTVLRDFPEQTPDLVALFAEVASEEVTDVNYGQLAVLAESINDDISFPLLQDLTRLRSAIASLRKSGTNVDVVEMYLDAGMIEEARTELESVRTEHRNSQLLESIGRSAERLVDVIEALRKFDFDAESYRRDLDDFRMRLGTSDSETLKSQLLSLEERILSGSEKLLITKSDELLHEIHSLQVGERDVTPGMIQRRDDVFRSGNLHARLPLVAELVEIRQSMYVERRNELQGTILRLQSHAQEHIDDAEINLIVGSESVIVDSDFSVGDIMRLREKSLLLETELEAKKVTTWRYRDGETALVSHITRFMKERTGFRELDIKRFYASMKTKRFVMLGGLPGTGKSIFSRVFCESLGCTPSNGRFFRVAVRPNWKDPSEVLGCIDSANAIFVPGWLSTLIKRCHADSSNLYFCLLDEMNLAPVEQYLAELLSALEEELPSRDERPMISIYAEGVSLRNAHEWPARLPLPNNLYFIGTVNFDSTSDRISDRVIDRGNFIQLATKTGREHHLEAAEYSEPKWILEQIEWEKAVSRNPISESHEFLVELAELFEDFQIGIGFRTHVEVERYLANSRGFMTNTEALDTAVLQRLIPKFGGSTVTARESLQDLWERLHGMDLRLSAGVVRYWLDTSKETEAVLVGTDPFLGVVTSRIHDRADLEIEAELTTLDARPQVPQSKALGWQEMFRREMSPMSRKQDDILRSLVQWARTSENSRELLRPGIPCDEIVQFIRILGGSIERDQLIRRMRSLITDEVRRDAVSPRVAILTKSFASGSIEMLTVAPHNASLQPEGWVRRALAEVTKHSTNTQLLSDLIAWLLEDPETSELLRAGLDLAVLGSVAKDIGFVKGSQSLRVDVQDLLETEPSLGDHLKLSIEPTRVTLRRK